MTRVALVVLGDFGHSPRMRYHALSLAENGFTVDVVAYCNSSPGTDILSEEKINFHVMKNVPKFEAYFPSLLVYVFKTIYQAFSLLWHMLFIARPSHILVQNPPSIPTLIVVWFCCMVRRSKFIIDWHNYGHTILSMTLSEKHLLVKICRWVERFFGSLAHSAFCVSKAMQDDLAKNWKISAAVLYDRPPRMFRPIDTLPIKRRAILEKIGVESGILDQSPAIIISSTSWTPDEDFGILFDALNEYDDAKTSNSELPQVLCIVTGKGPMKSYYEKKITQNSLKHVKFWFPWLPIEYYSNLLACADLGISLHSSSSKVDLPMKIVDMFGCGLPVLALEYACIRELVQPDQTGLLFKTSDQLAKYIQNLLLPEGTNILQRYRRNVIDWQKLRWEENWNNIALPAFLN